MGRSGQKHRVGDVRPSQVIHTFGIGSIVDLPHFSAMVMGLEDWEDPSPRAVIAEERLIAMVRNHLGVPVEQLVSAPVPNSEIATNSPFDPEMLRGIPVSPFPRWVRCPLCSLIAPLDFGVFGLKEDPWRPDRTRYVHRNCQKARSGRPPDVVPVRFLVVCEEGHIDDFPWVAYVHGGTTNCQSLLRLYEFGVSAEAADISVKCDTCGVSKPMTLAFGEKAQATLGACGGYHPHLRHRIDNCKAKVRTSLSGASNLWFPVTMSALSIPSDGGRLEQLVEENWHNFEEAEGPRDIGKFRRFSAMDAFAEWGDEEIWAAVDAHRSRSGNESEQQSFGKLREEEWKVFSRPKLAPESRDFRLREVGAPPGYDDWFESVVQVERLRVVNALTGFTRIYSPGDYADVNEIPEQRRVALGRKRPTWVPASEVRGEGVFLRFRENAVEQWLRRTGVAKLERRFSFAHEQFRRVRKIEKPEANFPGLRYVLLHSLSHALIRQFSVECGYAAASLQERIYSRSDTAEDGPMAAILLYTAAADSEGTLGGLVSLGEPETLARHLDQALEEIRLCASDPLCSEHEPGVDEVSLHGASCHACLFVSETSCERGNKYLDRKVLIQTLGGEPAPFFPEF